MAYMVPQAQAAVSEAEVRVTAAPRSTQKRWPMALSIWAAIGVALAMWTGIIWLISGVIGIFS